jgi:hypothetical protein
MRLHDLASEASACRSLAKEFEGRPEAPFLLRLATEFDQLATTRERSAGLHEEDGPYFGNEPRKRLRPQSGRPIQTLV